MLTQLTSNDLLEIEKYCSKKFKNYRFKHFVYTGLDENEEGFFGVALFLDNKLVTKLRGENLKEIKNVISAYCDGLSG